MSACSMRTANGSPVHEAVRIDGFPCRSQYPLTPVDYPIRTACPDDHDAVQALLEASYPALFRGWYDGDVLAAALPLMTKANRKLLASGRFFIAANGDGIIVGCGGWSLDRPGSGEIETGLGHVRHFATHPGRLRQGIGGALLQRSVDDAGSQGVMRLECNSSLAAVDFYRTAGFHDTGPVRVDLGGGVTLPGLLMHRNL